MQLSSFLIQDGHQASEKISKRNYSLNLNMLYNLGKFQLPRLKNEQVIFPTSLPCESWHLMNAGLLHRVVVGLVDYSGGSSQDLVLHFTQTQGGQSSRPMTQGSQASTLAPNSQHCQQPVMSQAEHVLHHPSNEHADEIVSQPIRGKTSQRGEILSKPGQNRPTELSHWSSGTGSSNSQSQGQLLYHKFCYEMIVH